VFLLVPAHPGSPGQRSVKWSLLCVSMSLSCTIAKISVISQNLKRSYDPEDTPFEGCQSCLVLVSINPHTTYEVLASTITEILGPKILKWVVALTMLVEVICHPKANT